MVRTQIQLTEDQAKRLKEVAARRGVSMAELIRQSIETLMQKGSEKPLEIRARAIAASGKLRSGRSDIGLRHDEYLAEDFHT